MFSSEATLPKHPPLSMIKLNKTTLFSGELAVWDTVNPLLINQNQTSRFFSTKDYPSHRTSKIYIQPFPLTQSYCGLDSQTRMFPVHMYLHIYSASIYVAKHMYTHMHGNFQTRAYLYIYTNIH